MNRALRSHSSSVVGEVPLADRPVRDERISLAPMVDKSDRDWRRVMRILTRRSLLYTEMIAAPAVIHGVRDRILGFDPAEHPLALQLGWDVPEETAEAARIGEGAGYDEINLNVGCPSDKVQRHDFGACLMARPDHVAKIVDAMARAVTLPVTVKHRIGIRGTGRSLETYDDMKAFVAVLRDAGCRKFIVHSRIAVLEGLSPKENREVPPLRPEEVYRLKEEFPDLRIEINGGYRTAEAVDAALERVDGVMLGRTALENPWFLSDVDCRWFGETTPRPSRRTVLDESIPYLVRRAREGAPVGRLIQPLFHLFAGKPGAKKWKRSLNALPGGDPRSLETALRSAMSRVDPTILDE